MTPGPWRVQNRYYDFAIWGPTVKIGHVETHTPLICTLQQLSDNENQKSDANLIVAAPDLLASLKEMLEWANRAGCSEAFQLNARRAIAKANGESLAPTHICGTPNTSCDVECARLDDETGMTADERGWIG